MTDFLFSSIVGRLNALDFQEQEVAIATTQLDD
jgi:hypothetical protein